MISDLWLDITNYSKPNPTTTISFAFALFFAIQRIYQSLNRTPRLQGPHSKSFLFGVTRKVFPSSDVGFVYQDWERTYGPVYQIPASFGSRHVVLSDPKAIAHLFSKDTTTYYQPAIQRAVGKKIFGDLMVTVEGETHKRQRRVLSSAFSISAIRNLTPLFLDSAHQLKAAWDSFFQSDGSTDAVIIDVQKWMNYFALDNVGNAGFSHDFGTLRGQTSSVLNAFNSFSAVKPSLPIRLSLLIGPLFPRLFVMIPNQRKEKLAEVAASLKVIALDLLNKASKETQDNDVHQSILGVMIRSESASSNIRLSTDEIIAQVNMFILAGYETTAITLTWALIELARRPEVQETLRAELRDAFAAGGPTTFDQLMNDLPYLNAFTCELLRLHLPEPQTMREAIEDDTIPLTDPIRTASGKIINSLFVAKGTVIRIPFAGVNMSETLWGMDAGEFDPGRWLVPEDDKKTRKEEVKGYRNLLTFAHGPRMCPGRNFAVTEMKAVLSVLVRNFVFEFPNGPSTKLESHFLRPKVAGEDGPKVPILVRKVT